MMILRYNIYNKKEGGGSTHTYTHTCAFQGNTPAKSRILHSIFMIMCCDDDDGGFNKMIQGFNIKAFRKLRETQTSFHYMTVWMVC